MAQRQALRLLAGAQPRQPDHWRQNHELEDQGYRQPGGGAASGGQRPTLIGQHFGSVPPVEEGPLPAVMPEPRPADRGPDTSLAGSGLRHPGRRAPDPGRGERPSQVRGPLRPDPAATEPERSTDHPGPNRGHPRRGLRLSPLETERYRPAPVQPDEVGDPGLGHGQRRLPGGRHPQGAPGQFPRRQRPGGEGRLPPARHLPQPERRVGGDRPPRHGAARIHHQAPVLLRPQEEVPGPVRQDSGLRAVQRSFRTGDVWFAHNLAVNLAQISGAGLRETEPGFWTRLGEFSTSSQVQNPSLSLSSVRHGYREDRDEIRSPKSLELSSGIFSRPPFWRSGSRRHTSRMIHSP